MKAVGWKRHNQFFIQGKVFTIMRTIEISNSFLTVRDLTESVNKENIILKTDEGRMFVFAEIDDFDREIQLTRENKDLMQFLDGRSLDGRSKETGTRNIAQVRERLGLNDT